MSRRHKVPNAAATQAQADMQTQAAAKARSEPAAKPQSTSKQTSATKQPQAAAKPKSGGKHTPAPKQRTTLMTIAIALVFLHGLVATAIVFAYLYSIGGIGEINKQILFGVHAAAAVASVIAAVALWYWKRWGIYLYAAAIVVSAAMALMLVGMYGIFAELVPAFVVIYILYPKIKLFD